MNKFWFFVYNFILLPVFWITFRILSLFNPKIREGFSGRKEIFSSMENFKKSSPGLPVIIIHSSSLGEYQQAIPVVRQLLSKKIFSLVFTFFSPSGYKNSKVNFQNSIKSYLPFDTIGNAKKLFDILNPELIILMRYDLWFNFLYEAKKRNIKTVITNARFDENDKIWKIPLLKSFKITLFKMINTLFVIDDEDERNYKQKLHNSYTEIIKVGDSKFERVFEVAKNEEAARLLDSKITEGKKIFVMGSSWKDDEEIILPVLNNIIKYDNTLLTILVPHEPKETKLLMIEKNISENFDNLKSIRYSEIEKYSGENIIIVDSIGKLMSFYSIAYMSYVGGGFRTGLHNILEPVIFNMPVFFANEVKNSDEDEVLLNAGCGFLVNDKKSFYRNFREILINKDLRDEIGKKCSLVFDNKLGTAKKIIDYLYN